MSNMTLQELETHIVDNHNRKRDLKVMTNKDITVVPHGKEVAVVDKEYGMFVPTWLWHSQTYTETDIRSHYYKKCLADDPAHLADELNYWFKKNPTQRLFRGFAGDNGPGVFRANLSPSFKLSLDNYDVAKGLVPVFGEMRQAGVQLEVISCDINPDRMFIKALSPKLKADVVPGHPVQAGFMIRNGEVGNASFEISTILYELVCRNGAVHEKLLEKRHVGSRHQYTAQREILISDETRNAQALAFSLEVRDYVRASLLDERRFLGTVNRLQQLVAMKVEKPLHAIEMLGEELNLKKNEIEAAKNRLIETQPLAGKYSIFDLTRAITNTANDPAFDAPIDVTATVIEEFKESQQPKRKQDQTPDEKKPLTGGYDRATDLQRAGGSVLGLADSLLGEIAKAA